MKKTVFLIIITAITVLCILLGAFRHLHISDKPSKKFGSSIGRSIHNATSFADDFFDDLDDDAEWSYNDSDNLEKFDSIKIDGHVMGIEIKYGSTYSINTKYIHDWMKPAHKVSDGVLKISQPGFRRKRVANGNCKVSITIPQGIKLDSLHINVDVGGVTIDDLQIEDGVISTDVGGIDLDNVEFETFKITSDVGGVSVNLASPISEYTLDVRSDIGGISVTGASAKRSYSQYGTTDKYLKVKTDVGGIEIKQ